MYHVPVLLAACMEALLTKTDGVYVDGTLGGGGHSEAILERLPSCRLYGIDKDEEAIRSAAARLAPYAERFQPLQGDFHHARAILSGVGVTQVDGILLDLGVSSHQLDEASRGFSYQEDAVLDMRMDARQAFSAKEVVGGYSEAELLRVIRDYGEEHWAARIAKFIVEARTAAPIETTGQLVGIIKRAIPAKLRENGPHPAKRTFQAIRIEVNDELRPLGAAIESLVELLSPGGRMAVITFHSLEDRIVKQTFHKLANPCTCPKSAPICICGKVPSLRVVNKKPIVADLDEMDENPRARSAKLRVAQKI